MMLGDLEEKKRNYNTQWRVHWIVSRMRWLTFILDDVPAAHQKLKSQGVEFLAEPVSAPDAKHVVCAKGPDGMLIELVQVN